MTSKPDEHREALRKIAEAMAQDLMNSSLEEALKELKEVDSETSNQLRGGVASLMTRLKKERLAAARRAYDEEMSRTRAKHAGPIGQAREVLMAKVNEILARQPALKLAFRGRVENRMTERELATILEDLRELEEHARK